MIYIKAFFDKKAAKKKFTSSKILPLPKKSGPILGPNNIIKRKIYDIYIKAFFDKKAAKK